MRQLGAIFLLFGLPLALAATPPVVARVAAPHSEAWLEQQRGGWAGGEAPNAVKGLRQLNPEYDLMSRTFLGLALADRALGGELPREEALTTLDAIIADSLATEGRDGQRGWLLSYADASPWKGDGGSLFVNGELLVLIGARRLVDSNRWGAEMAERAARVEASLGAVGPYPIAESYPDEGWTFCHSMAMVGLRMHEVIDGADHGAAKAAWLSFAAARLMDPDSGLLASEFHMDATIEDGPEGSSLWFAITALRILDPELGATQYALAREALGGSILGLGYAREWPRGALAMEDVDSGPIVPGIEASASSSGLAIAAAAAWGDARWHGQLRAALGAAEVVMATDPRLAAVGDNPLGQAVILWGLGFGPTWARLEKPG